ncbi:hypothetical protein [Methylophaga sp. OBS1]|uniref:hypothetical protein n=1 Tax=Methylophaga sp. OBS1 TaxID=2991933 RepID=UPI0022548C61|nr:hypothetical protein [Methylophaga sp. OBS1]
MLIHKHARLTLDNLLCSDVFYRLDHIAVDGDRIIFRSGLEFQPDSRDGGVVECHPILNLLEIHHICAWTFGLISARPRLILRIPVNQLLNKLFTRRLRACQRNIDEEQRYDEGQH